MRPYWALILPNGDEYPLTREQGIVVEQAHGVGMPPITNTLTPYAILDGASWQCNRAESRLIQFLLTVKAKGGRSSYYALRRALIESVNPHRLAAPIELRYYGYDGMQRGYVYYDAGLERGNEQAGSEQITLRLIMPDPYFYGDEESAAITPATTIENYYILSLTDGVWGNMAGGVGGGLDVDALAAAPNGGVYAGGFFTQIGGVPANRIAYWNGVNWSALGAGVDGAVWAIAIAPNGDVYVGGQFVNAGGAPAAYIAYWDISASAWVALGAGMDATVRGLAFGPTGLLYAVGDFTMAGGAAANRVAVWNGVNWSALGAGVNAQALAVAVDTSGDVYVGGQFVNAGGAPAARIARWDGSAWSALGTGCNDIVNVLTIASNGDVYAGGQFTAAGGVTVNYIARWNGQAWLPLGAGVNSTVVSLRFLNNGFLAAGGGFSFAGGITVGRAALWNGYSWGTIAVNITGFAENVHAIAEDKVSGVLYLGGTFREAPPGFQCSVASTVVNPGTARSYPLIEIRATAAGQRLLYLRNETNGATMWFDYLLQDGEMLSIDTRPGQRRVVSSFFGVLVGNTPLPGSQLTSWLLEPGSNRISAFVQYTAALAATITLRWSPSYWGID